MEIIDIATENTLAETERLIRVASSGTKLQETGHCLYCSEALKGRRFCDVDCRDDYEREQTLLKYGGF